jgi:hypothetical protein
MNAPSAFPEADDLARRALRREAEARIADGQELVEGEWLPAAAARRARRVRAWRALGESVEALVLWTVIALIGLGFLGLVTIIL